MLAHDVWILICHMSKFNYQNISRETDPDSNAQMVGVHKADKVCFVSCLKSKVRSLPELMCR